MTEDIKLPNKKYNIIYADPPWKFNSGELFKEYAQVKKFDSIEKHYKTLNKKELQQLKIKEITHNDCVLFMWFTDAHFIEAIELCKSWGFEYKTIAFVWEKRSKHNKLISNLGSWTLKNYELCLLATKGKMMKYKKINNIKQQVIAERTKHSRKPDIVRNNIEKLFGDIPRIELFARETAVGWDSWGNEV